MSAKNNVFDLEEAVKAWAWDEYTSTENRRQRKLRQKEFANPNTCLCVNADWSHVSIVDESKWPRLQQVAFDDVDHGGSDDALNVKFDAQQLRGYRVRTKRRPQRPSSIQKTSSSAMRPDRPKRPAPPVVRPAGQNLSV